MKDPPASARKRTANRKAKVLAGGVVVWLLSQGMTVTVQIRYGTVDGHVWYGPDRPARIRPVRVL